MATLGSLGKLGVTLTANSAKLAKELAQSRQKIAGWAKGVGKSIAKIGAIGAGAAAVIGGAFFVALNRTAGEIDKITKAAGKLDFNIEEYQKLAFIASKSNIETETLTKGIERMQKTIGDARDGLSTATKAFGQLNLNVDELASMSPSEQFAAIANEIGNVATQADRMKVIRDIFGRAGGDLLNVFKSDIAGISAEFDSLGIVLTQRQADMVAAFQDSKTSLFRLYDGFKQQITAQIAPALTFIIEQVTAYIKQMGGMERVAEKAAKVVVAALKGIIKFGSEVYKMFLEAELGIEKTMLAGMKLGNVMRTLLPGLRLLTEGYSAEELADTALNIQRIQQRLDEGIPRINQSVTDFIDGINNAIGQQSASINDTVTNMIAADLAGPAREAFLKQKEAEREAAAKAAEQQNKVAEAAAAAAKTLDKVTESRAWKDIFGKEEVTARSNQFDQYAKLVADNIQNNSKFTESNLNTLRSILQTAINNGGMGFSNNNLFEKLDLQGMADVIKGLSMQAQAMQTLAGSGDNQTAVIESATAAKTTATNTELINQGITKQNGLMQQVLDKSSSANESLGMINIDLRTDTDRIAGEIFGKPKFLQQLKNFIDRQTTDAARQVTS